MRFKYKRTLHIVAVLSLLFCAFFAFRQSAVDDAFLSGREAVRSDLELDGVESNPFDTVHGMHVGRRSLDGIVDPRPVDSKKHPSRLSDGIKEEDRYIENPRTGGRFHLKPTGVNPNTLPTQVDDLFLSVKTSKKYHRERLNILLETWVQLAKDQTFFFTDADDSEYAQKTNGHLINTQCSQGHNRHDLCCKMSVEYEYFLQSNKRWFCHVDDDTYLNVHRLVQMLQDYNHTKEWYIGKPSLTHPIEMDDVDRPNEKISFWFATGGAGYCISRALALGMMPYAGGGKLLEVCESIRLPDDCSIGYIITHLLGKDLTINRDFHSHLEGLALLSQSNLHQHITLSYAPYGSKRNVINVSGFNQNEDPTRFRSIHCILYPNFKDCPQAMR